MAYFHTTPQGRIINRLTKDTADVDKNLADFSAFYIRSFLQLLSTVVVIGATVPFALPAIIPILLLFYFLYQYFQVCPLMVRRQMHVLLMRQMVPQKATCRVRADRPSFCVTLAASEAAVMRSIACRRARALGHKH